MPIKVEPITANLGAEVSGVDMANVDDATRDELRKAWLDHKVLVLRDQHSDTNDFLPAYRLCGRTGFDGLSGGVA